MDRCVAIQYCAEPSLYSVPDGKLIRRLSQPRPFREVVFTPDGKQLVTGSLDRLSLTAWDVTTGDEPEDARRRRHGYWLPGPLARRQDGGRGRHPI